MKKPILILVILLLVSMVSMIGVNTVYATTTKLSVDSFTRFYLPSTGAAPVNPAFSGDWETTAGVDRLKCVTGRISSAMTSKTSSETSLDSSYDVLTRQYVSDPIQAQTTISGTVKGQIRCSETSGAQFSRAIVIKVIKSDLSVRGTLLSYFPASLTSEYATSLTNRNFPPSLALTSVTALANDRIVIEIGTRAFNTLSTSYTATHRFGDSISTTPSDLPEDEASTSDYNPWIQFSQTILFATPAATRFYLPSSGVGGAAVYPAFSGDWEKNTDADRLRCSTTKIGSVMSSKTSSENIVTSSYDVLTRQYVSDPIQAQTTISGTVKGQIRTMESNIAADFNRAIVIKVVSNDGLTVRGTLLSYFPASLTSEYATSLTNRNFPPSLALTSVTALANDRIVIEIGTRAFNTHTTSRTATHSFGDNSATDLTEDESTTTANNPWIEFSQTILFATFSASFKVNINITDVTDLYSFNLKLFYKTTVVSATDIAIGPFLLPTYATVRKEINNTVGYAWCAFSQGIGETTGVSGSGTLVTITLTVNGLGASSLYLVDIGLGDSLGRPIAHEVYDGHFANSNVHDIAITSVTPNATSVILGQTISVSVTAINHGNFTQSFTVATYASPYPSRFYLPSTGAAPVNPGFSGDWETTAGVDRLKCVTTRINSAMTSKTSSENVVTSSYDVLTRQYVSDPIQAQTISGTVKGQIRTIESSIDADFSRAIVIKVVSNDGLTVRGTLLSHFPASLTSEYSNTNLTNRYFPPSYTALTSVVALANDRIVIEIGTRAFNTLSTSYTATHSFGDNNTADLTENEVTTLAYNPWIEFSQPILFASTTAIGPSQNVNNLARGGRATLTFTWNTAGVTLGKYLIKANATTVSGETDTTDNTCNKAYDYDNKIFFYVTITIIDYPEAVFNYSPAPPWPPGLPNAYKEVLFNASDSDPHGGYLNYYYWHFDDGDEAASLVLPHTTHRYNCSLTYNVTLLIRDNEGLTDKTWQLVTVTFASDIMSPQRIVDCYDLAFMGKAYGWTGTKDIHIADTTGPTESPADSALYPPDGKVDNVDLNLMGKEYGSSLPS